LTHLAIRSEPDHSLSGSKGLTYTNPSTCANRHSANPVKTLAAQRIHRRVENRLSHATSSQKCFKQASKRPEIHQKNLSTGVS
ncbi:hypothetical protein, partial [Bifidobacterium adolescentis]|uniref:hypothetical protein n=3 Tax=Bifidobacterium adolescentis TaxID=1680 RepID=UPI0022E22B74